MIQLKFHDNRTGHDDIVFTFFAYQQICDSYYFFIDSNFSSEENIDKFVKVFNKLVDQWLDYIRLLGDEDSIYLPFDFSDQYTGCARVVKHGDNLAITPGWSNIEGWSVFPSDISTYVKRVNDFRSSYSVQLVQTNEILDQLEQCLIKT